MSISIKIINTSDNLLPAYATAGAAGMDIMAALEADVILQSGERKLIPTGLFLEIPQGYEAQIRSRSGLAIHQGIACLNSPGTIDSDYRGEIKIILINHSNTLQTIKHSDRIAQIVFAKVEKAEWIEVKQLSESERGSNGFGHTGK